jgi:2-keto-3-deoxy-L-rhamnonate aldolase RhmA
VTNQLKQQWRAGGVSYGVGLTIPSVATAQLLAHVGFNCLMIDM